MKCPNCRNSLKTPDKDGGCGKPQCSKRLQEAAVWARKVVSKALAHYPTDFFTAKRKTHN